ncbi:Ent-kaurene oxidase [Cyphellophora attinorum]|uniref:Ent-kaurene oxidase n=1 Tax=Cyphellophora attinorum TaxID=1664694 RepID=A0A0N0NPT3_9EURO|nr:Ent-kaurene oxidase [Phialophora attinorum]KPI43088.1 Ent-kaurene oxidase [Phialophora attinorum]
MRVSITYIIVDSMAMAETMRYKLSIAGDYFPDHPCPPDSTSPTMTQATWIRSIGWSLTIFVLARWFSYYRRAPKVLAVGFWPVPYLGSWVAAIKFMLWPVDMVKEGIKKSKNGIFRIATLNDEFVLVTTKDKVAEYLKASDSVLSMQDGANDQQQIPFTMGFGVAYRTYHNIVVRKKITPSIPAFTPIMVDEISAALTQEIGTPQDYKPITFYRAIAMTVARTSNRVYVGKSLATHEAYLQNATDYAQAVVVSAEILRLVPHWLKSTVVKFLPVTTCMKKAVAYLGPQVEERLSRKDSNRNREDDLLQWLLDEAPPIEKTVYQLVERVMALNVASIHTTTMTFTAAIYSLALEPEKYMDTLRDEVINSLEDGKISFGSIQKLVHVDSFLRESARYNVAGLMAMQRNAKQSFTFSDGTVIPAGAKVGAPTLILQRDASSYENPQDFEGFRFVSTRDGQPELSKSMVTTGTDYHLYGHGRHPCPGRFFATHEMKILFATLLLRYDFKLKSGAKPQEIRIGTMAIPDTTLEVLFKAVPSLKTATKLTA